MGGVQECLFGATLHPHASAISHSSHSMAHARCFTIYFHHNSLFFYLVAPLTCNSSLSCSVFVTTIIADIADSWGTTYRLGMLMQVLGYTQFSRQLLPNSVKYPLFSIQRCYSQFSSFNCTSPTFFASVAVRRVDIFPLSLLMFLPKYF